MKPSLTPEFLVYAPEPARYRKFQQRLERYGRLRKATSLAELDKKLADPKSRASGVLADVTTMTEARRVSASVRRTQRLVLGVVIVKQTELAFDPGPSQPTGPRVLLSDWTTQEIAFTAFIGGTLVRAATHDRFVAAVVDDLGLSLSLSPKQLRMAALSTQTIERRALRAAMDVNENTLKSQIKSVLRELQMGSWDEMGKAVLAAALARASGTNADAMPGSTKRPRAPKR